MNPRESAFFAPDTDETLALAHAIDDLLDTVVPAAMLQWSQRSGHDVVLISDLGGTSDRIFVAEATPLRKAG